MSKGVQIVDVYLENNITSSSDRGGVGSGTEELRLKRCTLYNSITFS